jgi:hypothetical protein
MRVLSPALALVLLAAPALAQDFTEDQKAMFIDAIAANDCSMTEDEAEELMPAAGITREVSGAIAVHLVESGLAVRAEDMKLLTLSDEICQ